MKQVVNAILIGVEIEAVSETTFELQTGETDNCDNIDILELVKAPDESGGTDAITRLGIGIIAQIKYLS